MARRRNRQSRVTSSHAAQKDEPSFWRRKRSWVIGGALGTALTWVLLNGPSALSNARILPGELQKTLDVFLSWYYDDEKWTGTWSSREEGIIDDLKQAELPLKLSIDTKHGKVLGEMFNRSVCELSPLLPPVLVEGEIRRGELVAYAFAYVGGERRLLYEFSGTQGEREPVLTLTPLKDPVGLLPPSARLVHRLEKAPVQTHLAGNREDEHPDLACVESPVEYIQRLRKEGRVNGGEGALDERSR